MKIQIDGVGTVEVGDDFKSMKPEDQNSFIAHISEQAGNGVKSALPQESGAQQVARSLLGGVPFSDRAMAGMQSLHDTLAGSGEGYDANLAKVRAQNEQLAQEHPVGNFIGNMIGGAALPVGAINAIKLPATLAGKVGAGALSGAGIGAVQGASGAQDLTNIPDVAKNTAIGAGVGGLVGGSIPAVAKGVGGLLSRAVTPLPIESTRAPLVATLDREGIPLTAGQRTGSKPLQWLESTIGDIPGAGAGAHSIQDQQKQTFTQAALKRAGIDAPLATPDVMAEGRDVLGNKFDELSARNSITVDQQIGDDILNVARQYDRTLLPSQQKPSVRNTLADIVDIEGDRIPGDVYQSQRSWLGKQAELNKIADPNTADALRGIKGLLDRAMGRSISPEDKASWDLTNKQYGNYKTLEKAAGGAGSNAAEGMISPSALRQAIASGNNRGQYVRGQGDFADLARAGVGVMSPLPQSGTAPRHYAQGLLAIPGAVAGSMAAGAPGAAIGGMLAAGAPALAGRALMSRPMQAYLANQVIPKGSTAASDAVGLLGAVGAQPGLLSYQREKRRQNK